MVKNSYDSDLVISTLNITVLEQQKESPVIIYNHQGEPFTKPTVKMGFDLTRKNNHD